MSKAKKTGDLYLAHSVQVRRDDPKNPKPTHTAVVSHPEPANLVTIPHGQMTSDTDLSDAEIEELKQYPGVLRAPTFEEMQAMDTKDEQKAAGEDAKAVATERQRLFNDQEIERQRLETEQRTEAEEKKAKLAETQAKEREDAEKKAGKSRK